MSNRVLLEAKDISKSYAEVHALRSASLELRSGEVHAIIGENGAGKSTLIKVLTGAITPDGGELQLGGQTVRRYSPRIARSLGVAAIYQQPLLFPQLTVAENLALGTEDIAITRRVDWRTRRERASNLLRQVGAQIDPDTDAGSLTMPQQQLVEIARALGANAKILILDEPTASLSEQDTKNLFHIINGLREQGVGMIYISHRLEELPVIADRVTVLRDGVTVGTYLMSDVNRKRLIQLMVGRDLSAVFPKREVERGEVVLELCGLSCSQSGVKDVNLSVRRGEIVGVAGLVGSGRTELAGTIFGLTPADKGEIRLQGKDITPKTPIDAIKQGIAYVPEDRRRHGVVLDLPISQNITLASLAVLSGPLGLDFQKEKEVAAQYCRQLGVKTPTIYAPVGALSGGNQQKVALSRWLMTNPFVLILDEPTQGIDVGAKSEIHALMTKLAEDGVAIIMISSELPEILGMSDRIVVMREGSIVATLEREEATQEKILALALGHKDENIETEAYR